MCWFDPDECRNMCQAYGSTSEVRLSYVALTRGKYHENLCIQVHNSLDQGEPFFEDDRTFTKNIIKELLNK